MRPLIKWLFCAFIVITPAFSQTAPLTITTTSVPNGAVQTAYSANVQSTGGAGSARTWSISAGNLPPGLSISGTTATATISGTPTTSGTYSFSARVQDQTGAQATQSLAVFVSAPSQSALTITTGNVLPAGNVGNPYSLTFAGSGGAPPYSWAFAGGNAPNGLTLSADGLLSGTPTTPSTYNFSVQLNALGLTPPGSTSKAFTLRITAPLSITTTSPIPATAGAPLGPFVLQAAGGAPPYLWFVAPGSQQLPPWLSVDASSGFLSGTPPAAGTFPFTIQVNDSAQSTLTKALSVVVAPPLTISTASAAPAGTVGSNYSLTFAATGGNSPFSWAVDSGALPPGLTLNTATGALTGSPQAAGAYSFVIRTTDFAKATVTKAFTLTVGGGGPAASALISTNTLDFNALAGGDSPAPQSVSLASTGAPLQFTVQIDGGATGLPAAWLTVRPLKGSTPARITAIVNTTGITAGTYKARILLNTSDGKQNIVTVNLNVTAADPILDVSPGYLRFSGSPSPAGLLEQDLLVRNLGGGGPLTFTASPAEGSAWLSIRQEATSAGPNAPTLVRVFVNTQSLPKGPRRGLIRLRSSAGDFEVPVTLLVQDAGPVIGFNVSGLRFEARDGHGNSNTRNANVLNLGQGSVNWSADIVTGGDWLSLGATTGSSTPGVPSRLPLSANPGSRGSGGYYAVVRITDPGALNSPQYFMVMLNVADEGSPALPDPAPSGLFFVGATAGAAPAAQQIRVFTSSNTPVSFQASANTSDGGDWLSVDPVSGTTSTQGVAQVNVTVRPLNLRPGTYSGDVTFAFSSTAIRTANITLVVQPASAGASAAKEKAAAGCTPAKLSLTQTGLVNDFAAPAGWPTPLIVRLADDCGDPVLSGQVVATFSNGDPAMQMRLTVPENGLYSATWSPGSSTGSVTVTARANAPNLQSTVADISGAVTPQKVPVLFPNRVVANLNSRNGAPLSSGMVAQLFGSALAPSIAEPNVIPLPKAFNGTRVVIGGFEAPLYYLSDGQLNVQVPTELEPNKEYSIFVEANGGYTLPDTILLAQTQPGVVAFSDGRLVAQHSDAVASLVTATSPARPGETITIYLVGMGETDPPVATSAPSPSVEPLARVKSQPTVTIGGKSPTILYAGLTPFLVGLYQITMTLPADVSGDLPVIITQDGVEANATVLTVR
jgi:uncharacterized protein (TIGR03437 family)